MLENIVHFINEIIHFLDNQKLLEQDWWQGVAGITQILAAIITLIAFFLARKTLLQGEKAREESVAPAWDIVDENITTNIHSDPEKYYYIEGELDLKNTGFGPARNISLDFKSFNGYKPEKVDIIGMKKNSRSVLQEKKLKVLVRWDIDEPPAGILIIKCLTRLDNISEKKFYIKTYLDDKQFTMGNLGGWKIEPYIKSGILNKLVKRYKSLRNKEGIPSAKNYYEMEQWIKNNFEVQEESFEGGHIILERNENGGYTSVSVRNLVSMIGHVNVPPTASELKKALPQSAGWKKHFDKWWMKESLNLKKLINFV